MIARSQPGLAFQLIVEVIKRGGPVAWAQKATDGPHWVADCPFCEKSHFHDSGEGVRLAHCGKGLAYYLKLTPAMRFSSISRSC